MLKDHKPKFPNEIKCRLINPTKSNIGKISKQILQKINDKVRSQLGLQQWRSTEDTITWFKNIPNKKNLEFIQFDIEDFYPSISEDLFNKALDFAGQVTHISQEERKILKNARQSILYHNDRVWQKHQGLFDVTMGSYDGCEVCETVGLFIIYTIRQEFPQLDFGLYRDDGVGAMTITPKPEQVRTEKKLKAAFKKHFGLTITCDTGLNTINSLDVTFNMKNETYAPYRKPNDVPLYIHRESNHPPHVTKQLTTSVSKRLNTISCNKETFDEAKEDYEKALHDSNLCSSLKFEDKSKQKKPKKTEKKKTDLVHTSVQRCTKNKHRERVSETHR